MIPDLHKFFHMLCCLFSGTDKKIRIAAIQLYKSIFNKILVTEVEQSWNDTVSGILMMLGEEDAELRKHAKGLVL